MERCANSDQRTETAATSKQFADSLLFRRCLIKSDAFYEWLVLPNGNQPYAVARQDGQPLAFAGVWDTRKAPDQTRSRSFAILTTASNDTLASLNNRMPVVLEEADWPVWLGEAEGDALPCSSRWRRYPAPLVGESRGEQCAEQRGRAAGPDRRSHAAA